MIYHFYFYNFYSCIEGNKINELFKLTTFLAYKAQKIMIVS